MSGTRASAGVERQPRILLARDPRLSTCDALVRGLEIQGNAEVVDAASVEGARAWVRRVPLDLCLVCLDLPPAPRGGARLARELLGYGYPIVLITRSLRWLPAEDVELRRLPWVVPEADPMSVLAYLPDLRGHAMPVFGPREEMASSPDLG